MSQQLNSGRQQRAITPTVTTASFKPLSLDEIMLVPLAKQKAEDQMIMDMDELDLMATNALEADQAYVNAQRDAFTNEVGSVRDRLMTEGVDRSLINKFKGLRSRKNLEFSVNGNTGKANAAYNAMQLNKKNIMNNPRLSSEQKRLGMLEAESAYNRSGGVGAGAEYIDYIGNDEVDIQGESQKIAAQMTPQSIAEAKGYTFDGKTYKDSNGKEVTLTPEHIQRVAYETMKGNNKTMAYLKEAERLGIIDSADDELRKASINAGNIYQRKDSTISTNAQVGGMGKSGTDTSVNGQYWDSYYNMDTQTGMDVDTGVDDKTIENVGFNEDGSVKAQEDMPENLKNLEDRIKNMSESRRLMSVNSLRNWQVRHEDQYNAAMDIAKMRRDFPMVQGDNPATGKPYTDREIFNMSVAAKKKMSVSASQVYMPRNLKNSYVVNKNAILTRGGDKEVNGSFVDRHISIGGFEGDVKSVAKQIGVNYNDFTKAVRETGRLKGVSPNHPTMPGSDAFGIDINGETYTMYVDPGVKINDSYGRVSKMNRALMDGTRFTEGSKMNNVAGSYSHIVTELNPYSNELDQFQVISPRKISHKEYRDLKWVKQDDPPAIFAIDDNGNKHLKKTKEELERSLLNSIRNSWDETIQANTPYSSIKN